MIVMKFGGTSVGSADAFAQVAQIVREAVAHEEQATSPASWWSPAPCPASPTDDPSGGARRMLGRELPRGPAGQPAAQTSGRCGPAGGGWQRTRRVNARFFEQRLARARPAVQQYRRIPG